MRKDFKNLDIYAAFQPANGAEWQKANGIEANWKTPEHICVKPVYTKEDLEGMEHLDYAAGLPPYLRGPYSVMYTLRPWTIRQYAGFSTAEESNAFYRRNLASGQKGLSVAFDLATHRGYDPDHERVVGDVGKAGVSICSLENMKVLFDGIPLNKMSVSMTMNGAVLPIMAFYINAGLEQGAKLEEMAGTIQNDILKEFMVRNTYIYPPAFSMKIISDIFEYTSQKMPKFNSISISGYHMQEAGATADIELAYTLADGLEYLRAGVAAGIDIDAFAPRLSFFWAIGTNHFMEIAKMRAARMLWANIVASYNPECLRDCENKGPNGECRCAAKMKVHAETSTFNLTLFDAHVNLLRTQTEAMSAALGGVDSMTVVPFDKTYETPDEFSERLARNQQLLLKEESHFDKVIDPAAGSYYIENLTVSIAKQAWEIFLAIEEEEGGFYAALKAGTVQAAVNESNKARHKAVAQRREILLGTNQFPNFNEKAGDKKPVEATCCCGGHDTCEKDVTTLNFDRAASQFEALRLETEASGKRPKAFMLTIGNLAMRQARAQYSCNFLACAGYEVVDNLGFETVEAGVEAAMAAKADIVVLCSSDEEYAQYAVPAFQALNGRAMFIVAGNPECAEELKAAGIENFIHVRVNVLETLKEFNAKLLK